MIIDSYLESVNLEAAHVVLSIAGVMLSTHLMQLIWHNPEEGGLVLVWLRRINLALVAFGMIWSASYANERGWQPWPPGLLVLLSLDIMMTIRILVIYRMHWSRAKVRPLHLVPQPQERRRELVK